MFNCVHGNKHNYELIKQCVEAGTNQVLKLYKYIIKLQQKLTNANDQLLQFGLKIDNQNIKDSRSTKYRKLEQIMSYIHMMQHKNQCQFFPDVLLKIIKEYPECAAAANKFYFNKFKQQQNAQIANLKMSHEYVMHMAISGVVHGFGSIRHYREINKCVCEFVMFFVLVFLKQIVFVLLLV